MLGTDNRLCPGTCPNQMPCPDDSLTCNMVDANGCSMPTLCVPRTCKDISKFNLLVSGFFFFLPFYFYNLKSNFA
jgi:hypothetical protein